MAEGNPSPPPAPPSPTLAPAPTPALPASTPPTPAHSSPPISAPSPHLLRPIRRLSPLDFSFKLFLQFSPLPVPLAVAYKIEQV